MPNAQVIADVFAALAASNPGANMTIQDRNALIAAIDLMVAIHDSDRSKIRDSRETLDRAMDEVVEQYDRSTY